MKHPHSDFLIIGGGVIGLTTGYFLARAGHSVTLADRSEPGTESSWAGAGILEAAPALERARTDLDLLRAHSAHLFPSLSQELRERTGIDNGYHPCGGIDLLEESEEPSIRKEWEDAGTAFHPLGPEECPALAPGSARAYVLPKVAQVRNPRHLKALIAAYLAHGARILSGCPVLSLEIHQNKVRAVRTAQGDLTAERILIATGAWTEALCEPLGLRTHIRPVRGQMALLRCEALPLRQVIFHGRRYIVPRPDGRVLIGSTEEEAGFRKRVTASAIRELLDFGMKYVPALESAEVERTWSGLRPGNADGLPTIGAVPGVENLFLAAGHFRSGIQFSPGTAMVACNLMLGQAPSFSIESFRPGRF